MSTDAATKAKETVTTGREATAVALDRTSTLIRDTAKQAAGLVERGGEKAAHVLEGSAARVDPHWRGGVRGYITGHPRRFFVAGALFAALVAFLFVRSRLAGDEIDI
ncbi:MAG: hypothetical protein WD904_08600 [Dehalococcoidia bacterium]